MTRNTNYTEPLLVLVYAFIAALTIHRFNGTGDAGDSISHYLFAKYAPLHPELYFNHWAKPVFVLLASPFAQFGFVGIKVFNAIVSGLVLLFSYRCAKKLGYAYPWMTAAFVLGMPLYYILTFSGLTEPLFALFTVAGVYLCLNERYRTAALLLSFMPFVRSEGLVLMGVFGFYFLYRRQFWAIVLLGVGHVIYSIAGYFVYRDLFWVITQIPYARMDSYYGKGNATHFVEQLYYVIGLPIYILLGLGLISLVLPLFNRKKRNNTPEEVILIAGGFLAFLGAHTLFWTLGIFHSMGLPRVMLGVAPLMALLAGKGLQQTLAWIPENHKKWRLFLVADVLISGIILLGSDHPTGIHFEKTMYLNREQQEAQRMAEWLDTEIQKPETYLFSHPYLAEALNVDPFDRDVCKPFSMHNLRLMDSNSIAIWDAHFSVIESGVTLEDMHTLPLLHEQQRFIEPDGQARFILYRAFSVY